MSSPMQDGLMWRCVACGERNFNHYENCVACGRARLAGDDERRQRPLGVQAAPGTGRMMIHGRWPDLGVPHSFGSDTSTDGGWT